MLVSELKEWLGVLALLISVGGFLYAFLTKGSDKAIKEIAALREDLEKAQEKAQVRGEAITARFQLNEAKLLKIESDMTHLPDHGQTHRLELAVERLTGRMETLDERLKPVAAISDRLQEFLLEQARR